MQKYSKIAKSALAALLAVLYLMPAQMAEATGEIPTAIDGKDSIVHWSTTLPNTGDESYRTDENWYRLVLEYGDYCTNAINSTGNYVSTSSEETSSWPEVAWHNSEVAKARGYETPDNWIGKTKTDKWTGGTAIRADDAALYRNGEYSMNGMYSLYIKYAGYAKDGKTPTYYISPCDANGNREKKLWALDCCADMAAADVTTEQFTTDNMKINADEAWPDPGNRPILDGMKPTFNLLMPTYEEYETQDNFKYAGMAVPFFDSYTGRDSYSSHKDNNGHLYADYIDNNKWIFIENDDGSWAIKSAGYVDWDWSDLDGDLALMFGDPTDYFAEAIGSYILACGFGQLSGKKSRSDSGSEYGVLQRYYLVPWSTKTFMYLAAFEDSYSAHPSIFLVPMLWLNEYAQNVYLLGGYDYTWTYGFNPGIDQKTGVESTIQTGYGMNFINNMTAATYDEWLDKDIKNAYSVTEYWGGVNVYKRWYSKTANSYGKTIELTKTDASGKECAKTVDEIIKDLPVRMESHLNPKKGTGAFTGVYVGTPVSTAVYNKDNTEATISVTQSLGALDNNEDGCCDGGAFIGSLKGTGPTITINQGATLQIDGPTYASGGTRILVRGTLIISPGAFLAVQDNKENQNLWLEIYEGGEVIISSGAMLDLGSWEGGLRMYGGTLINNGVFIRGINPVNSALSYASVIMEGGTIENGGNGWFIAGASVRQHMRMNLLKYAANNYDFDNMCKYISNVADHGLQKYYNNYGAAIVSGQTYGDEDDQAYTFADVQMHNVNGKNNVFRNEGNVFINGAIKGQNGSDSRYLGSGNLYHGRDIYASTTASVTDASFTAHESICAASGKGPYEDELINSFYSMSNITVGSVYTDDNQETECLKNNVLALRVGTGSAGTDKIANFKIDYVGTDKQKHSEYISPAGLKKTYDFVCDCTYCGKGQNENGDSMLSPHNGWMEVFSESYHPEELVEYSNVTYIFQSLYPISYVESISFTGTGVGSWSCTELNLYRVKYLYPVREYGWSSWQWYVPFDGELIAEVPLTADSATGTKGDTFIWDAEEVEFGTGTYKLNVYGVPSGVSSKSDGGICYYDASTEEITYTVNEEDYYFSLSLADTDGAGIESFYNVGSDVCFKDLMEQAGVRKLETEDYIMMNLSYIDTNGSIHSAAMNFTLSAAEWAYYMLTDTQKEQNIHGLFQQGEEFGFTGILPDFVKLYSLSLTYEGSDDADNIFITSVSLSEKGDRTVSVEDGMLKTSNSGTVKYFYCSDSLSGTYVNCGQQMKVNMKEWTGTEKLKPQQSGTRYLVVVKTDEMSDAATMRDINVSFAYRTISDTPATTGTYNLRTAVNDYYGYWLSSNGIGTDCAYRVAVSSGGEMLFVIDVDNLYTFTSATFSIDADSNTTATDTTATGYDTTGRDEWQMSSIAIYEIKKLGERKVSLGTGVTTASVTTNRTYYRENQYSVRGAVNSGEGPLMVGPGQSKTITFEEGGGSTITGGESSSENLLTDIEELNYIDTKQDFGLNTKRAKYLITVHVDGASITSEEDGDCGSKNQFYFQLVFQDDNGKQRTSPMVLSNQQLRSDGFRTGTAEEFSIYTNDDYGTPVQINIIPDDTSSTSDVFDKLCIDYITVSKTSGTGVSLNWIAEDVGWIDIEYKDDGGEQTGRSDSELIRSFELKDGGYNVWIEFGIQTAPVYLNSTQFVGQVLADVTYRDTTGAIKTKTNIAVVGAIASYAERMSELGAATATGTEVSIPAYMFRNGYTNRFLVQFDDISSLINIKLKITPEDATQALSISQVFARQVFDEGTLSLNKLNEYEHYYSQTPQDLATSTNSKAVNIDPRGASASARFIFSSGNSIRISTSDEETKMSVTTGESEGKYDYITMTAKIEDITGIDFGSTISANVIYKDIYGNICKATSSLVYDNTTKLFMIPADSLPTTSDIGYPYQIELTSSTLSGKVLEKVTVCHMRGDTLLNEVEFAPGDGTDTELDAEVPLTLSVSDDVIDDYANEKGYTTETQNLFLKLGSLTQTTLLSKSKDLEVALIWTKDEDPYGHERESDYVSVLECGYTVLDSSSTLCIPFNISDISGITGIRLKTTDSTMAINVEQACISVEETSNLTGKRISSGSGWVNLTGSTARIATAGTTMNSDGKSLTEALSSSSRLTPINISMKVSNTGSDDTAVKLTLNYTDLSNGTGSVACQMDSADWNNVSAWILATGFKTPKYYTLEAMDSDASNTASCTVSGVEVTWYDSSGLCKTSDVSASVSLKEGTSVSTSLITTSLTGTVSVGTQSVTLENNAVKDERTDYSKLTLNKDGVINISAALSGLAGELEVSCVNLATNGTVYGPASAAASSDTVTCSIPVSANMGTETLHYCITVKSKNMSHQYSAKVYVDIQPALYIEGFVFKPDGSMMSQFKTTGQNSDVYSYAALNPNEVLTVYARVMNSSDTALTLGSTDGAAFTVTQTQNETVSGNAGTFTKYLITAGSTQVQTVCNFTIYSATDPTVSYTLQFTTAAIEPDTQPGTTSGSESGNGTGGPTS